jgi:hypothetical protein
MFEQIAGALAKILVPILAATIETEIKKYIPTMVQATVAAVTETITTAAIHGVDRVTDVIPGQLDDRFIDPIVASVLKRLQGLI